MDNVCYRKLSVIQTIRIEERRVRVHVCFDLHPKKWLTREPNCILRIKIHSGGKATHSDHMYEDESNLLTAALKYSDDHIKTLKDLYKEVPRNRRNGTPVTILGAICKLLINDYFLEKPYVQPKRSDLSFNQLQTEFLWTDYHRNQIS